MSVRDDSMREQIMQVGGTTLRVAIRPGTGTGPPLLLCNGIGMRLEAFQPNAGFKIECKRIVIYITVNIVSNLFTKISI
jgi:hypothetical protein